jgi:hypothetical protein
MPIQQTISTDDYAFLESVRSRILRDEDIPAEELNKALSLIVSASRESRTITANKPASKRGPRGPLPNLADLL